MRVFVLVFFLLQVGCAAENQSMSNSSAATSADAVAAVTLSATAFDSTEVVSTDYTVIRTERQLPHRIWRVTHKRKALIPSGEDTEIGKGGEIVVVVDLDSGQAKISGYGE